MTSQITPMTAGQKKQMVRVLEDAVDSGAFTKDEMDQILKVGNLVQADLIASLKKHAIVDKRFGIATVLGDVTIPIDYNSETCVDEYAKKVKGLKTTNYYNSDLNSKNFPSPSNKLIPGKTYTVKMIPIVSGNPTSEDCLVQLARHNGILVGAQGIAVIDTQKLPKGKYYVSFDNKENLWKDSAGSRRVPSVDAYDVGGFRFYLGHFENVWLADRVLLCFCDKSA